MTSAVKSADRVLDILEYFSLRDQTLTLGEVAGELSIPKSSTLMLLRNLEARGYLFREGNQGYRLDPALRAGIGGWVRRRQELLIFILVDRILARIIDIEGALVVWLSLTIYQLDRVGYELRAQRGVERLGHVFEAVQQNCEPLRRILDRDQLGRIVAPGIAEQHHAVIGVRIIQAIDAAAQPVGLDVGRNGRVLDPELGVGQREDFRQIHQMQVAHADRRVLGDQQIIG